jgi:hypothetical protein
MSNAIIAIFGNAEDATNAVESLVTKKRINQSRVSILTSDGVARESFGIETENMGSKGVAVGGSIGAAAGAILAGLTSVGTIATGGAGLLVAGPLVAVFAGAGAGALGGGILGGLIGMGFTEEKVKEFEAAVEEGMIIVAVDMKGYDDDTLIKEVFVANNAQSINVA